MPLGFVRYYNGLLWTGIYAPGPYAQGAVGLLSTTGPNWRTSYDRLILYAKSAKYSTAYAYRPDGRTLTFNLVSGVFTPEADVSDRLVELVDGSGNTTGWKYTNAANDEVETYDALGKLISLTSRAGLTQRIAYDTNGRLSSVTDAFGKSLTFKYDSSGRLSTMTDPNGGVYTYAYNSANNISSVTYPDKNTRTYTYNEPADLPGNEPYALTGIVDENNARYATYQYDNSQRILTTSHAGGADSYAFTYGTNQTTVTDPLSTARTFSFSTRLGVVKNTAVNQPCPSTCAGAGAATSYDANGNIASKTDFNGHVTKYNFDLTRNLETSRIEAYNTSVARTITTQWDANWRLPAKVAEPLRITTYAYDGDTGVHCGGAPGSLCSKTIEETTDANGSEGFNATLTGSSRTWTYTYDSHGRMLTAKGPRTDINSTTTYTYYTCTTGHQCGQVHTVTDPVGHVTTYDTYNAYGQPLTITDPNGVVTTLTYDARMRLKSRQVTTETTKFDYYPTGLLKQVTLPDSSYVLYTYDDAHRLTKISDGAGNSIQYTLDNMGNRKAENAYDPSNVLHRTHTRVYNSLNELHQDINAANTAAVTTTYGYDSNGNQKTINAPLSRNTTNTYDPLNRLSLITDPNKGSTYFGYDGQDNLTSVKDPRSLMTDYTYNGFGDLTKQVSPDTGTTTKTYDSGGNLATSTDARNAVSVYAYDAANRVSSITYKYNGVADQTIAFGYDTGTNGKGRLTSASDANHALSWTYDMHGRVTGKGLTIGGVHKSMGYGYTNADLTSLVTPSNQSVTYGYNTNHQVTSIKVNGTTVLSGVTYEPFGGVNGWTWGNGTTVSRTYNEDGLVSQIVTAGVTLRYSFDNANRISGITDSSNSALSWTYGYDLLDRLNSAKTSSLNDGWTYDANGNRLTQTGTTPITFWVSTSSNQLDATTGSLVRSYTYDTAGNTEEYGPNTFTYNNRGRMKSTSARSTNYLYNALGQMIEKSGTLGTTIFMQDEAGHLIGEYDGTGKLIEETVWLGDIPVATLRPHSGGGIDIYYVHTDHLNTPRKVSQPSTGALAWRWDTDPFGATAPNQNPAGLGTLVYNLRAPGQYYQAETGLNYNGFRDCYDPLTGRYCEPDPIGLYGGSYSTYVYVNGSPITHTDRFGLARKPPAVSGSAADDVYQNLPDMICDWWPAYCIARLWVCLEARCKYTNCSGTWYVTVTQWVPSRPTPEEVSRETPECTCTKKGPRRED
jgi:RHS repeat-associated protein